MRRASGLAIVALLLACTPVAEMTAPLPETAPPASEPTSDPPPATTGARDDRPRTRVIGVGDIMMARRVGAAMVAADDFGLPFARVADRLAAADITFGTLESTLARLGPPTQGDAFAADPRALEGVLDAGIDVVSLANNHVGDFGPASLLATLAALDDAGIDRFGAGADASEARTPAVLERNGIRFGFLGFNAIGETPRAGRSRAGAVRIAMQPRLGPLDDRHLDRFLTDVRALDARVDVVIVVPHWGAQYTFAVHPDQRRVARALVRAGADAVIGGHSHWVGRLERYRDVPIVYSLGNFVFDMDISRRTREGIAVELVFRGRELVSIDPLPIVIGDDWAPRFARGARARSIIADVTGR